MVRPYSGIAVGHLYGDVNYSNGSGTVSSTSVSFYNTWIRDDGHYLDVIAKAGKLRSDYQILGYGSANYDTPDYSLSAEYGYKKELSRGLLYRTAISTLFATDGLCYLSHD